MVSPQWPMRQGEIRAKSAFSAFGPSSFINSFQAIRDSFVLRSPIGLPKFCGVWYQKLSNGVWSTALSFGPPMHCKPSAGER